MFLKTGNVFVLIIHKHNSDTGNSDFQFFLFYSSVPHEGTKAHLEYTKLE